MSELKDITGMTFNRLTVEKRMPNNKHNQSQWLCKCICGEYRIITGSDIRTGGRKSCGCLRRSPVHKPHKIHGMTGSKTYSSWESMRERCFSKRATSYKLYGERGITVCDRWLVFSNFYNDMGDRPKGTTIDRINTDGNYEPGNCRWATAKQQARNRRDNNLVFAFGESKTVPEWSEDSRCAVVKVTLQKRIEAGWDVVRALITPPLIGWRKGVKGGWL